MPTYWLYTHGASGISHDPQVRGFWEVKDGYGLSVQQEVGTENSFHFAVPTIAADPERRYYLAEVILVYSLLPVGQPPLGTQGGRAVMTELHIFDGGRQIAGFNQPGQPRNDSFFWDVRPKYQQPLNTGLLITVGMRWELGIEETNRPLTPLVRFHAAGVLLAEDAAYHVIGTI